MSPQSMQDTALAVREGIRRCREAEYPFAVLAEFLDELRRRNWPENQVRLVERSMHGVLKALSDADRQLV